MAPAEAEEHPAAQRDNSPSLPVPEEKPIAELPKSVPLPSNPSPAPATLSTAPTGKITLSPNTNSKISSLIPSLTDLERIANGEDSDEPKYINGEAKEPFTYEQLMLYWNQYANKTKEDGKINVYTIMTASEPLLETPEEITVHVEHKIQEGQLQDEMIDLLNFLRPRLKNFNVSIQCKQVTRAVVNRLYTNVERYQYLVDKNPKLEEMRKRFNLDVNS
jgi:DNA polymerase-3 subunit gamma/tau